MRTLLVIDMLNDFCKKDGTLYVGDWIESVITTIKKELTKFRKSEDTVIYICDSHAPDDPEFNLFPKHCIEGSHGEIIVDDLEPEGKDEIVYKNTYSGCANGELPLLIPETSDVFVCGLCTSICVMETVSDLFKEGIVSHIFKEACCDLTLEAHETALRRMNILFGSRIVNLKM